MSVLGASRRRQTLWQQLLLVREVASLCEAVATEAEEEASKERPRRRGTTEKSEPVRDSDSGETQQRLTQGEEGTGSPADKLPCQELKALGFSDSQCQAIEAKGRFSLSPVALSNAKQLLQLCDKYGIPLDLIRDECKEFPSIFHRQPQELEAFFKHLLDAGVSKAQLGEVIRRTASFSRLGTMQQKLDYLQGLGVPNLSRFLLGYSRMFTKSVERWENSMLLLTETLGEELGKSMVIRFPPLLSNSPENFSLLANLLTQLVGKDGLLEVATVNPWLFRGKATTVSAMADYLKAALGFQKPDFQNFFLRIHNFPPAAQVGERLDLLRECLGDDMAREMVIREPELWPASPRVVQVFAGVSQMVSRDVAVTLLRQNPDLFRRAFDDDIKEVVYLLAAETGTMPEDVLSLKIWKRSFGALKSRVQFVKEQGVKIVLGSRSSRSQSGSQEVNLAFLTCPDKQFRTLFPSYQGP